MAGPPLSSSNSCWIPRFVPRHWIIWAYPSTISRWSRPSSDESSQSTPSQFAMVCTIGSGATVGSNMCGNVSIW